MQTEELTGGGAWNEWPRCIACDQLRQAECPVCLHASSTFALAEYLGQAESSRSSRVTTFGKDGEVIASATAGHDILLMCDECDEAFAPRFYNQCHACGHQHGFGVGSPDWLSREQWNFRMTLAVSCMVMGVIVLLMYFYWVLH